MDKIISLEKKIISKRIKKSTIEHFDTFLIIENNKTDIHYVKCYNKDSIFKKQDILMIHGLGGSVLSFINIIDNLTPLYNLYIIDLPGFGRSGTHELLNNKNVSTNKIIYFYTEVINKFINNLNLNDLILFGHSLGGLLSLSFVINSNISYKIKKIILLNPVGIFQFTNSYGFLIAMCAKYDLNLFYFNAFSKLTGDKRIKLSKLYKVFLFNSPTFSKGIANHFLKIHKTSKYNFEVESQSYINDINRIKIPIGLIYGGKDKIVPFYHGIYLQKKYNIPLHIVKHLGHCSSHKYPAVIEELAYAIHIMVSKCKKVEETNIETNIETLINFKNSLNILNNLCFRYHILKT